MKRKFALGLTLRSCLLSGCAGKTSGKVDCLSISVKDDGDTIFNESYSIGNAGVYEYKSHSGDAIYIDEHIAIPGNSNPAIHAYENRYTSDYEEYIYYGFVGRLTVEKNYYLDLDNRRIDCEKKYSKYKYDLNPSTSSKYADADNDLAYQCAKKNYYTYYSFVKSGNGDKDSNSFSVLLDLSDKSLSKHTYVSLGKGAVVTYKAK